MSEAWSRSPETAKITRLPDETQLGAIAKFHLPDTKPSLGRYDPGEVDSTEQIFGSPCAGKKLRRTRVKVLARTMY